MPLLVIVLFVAAVNIAATRYGVDSRDGRDWVSPAGPESRPTAR